MSKGARDSKTARPHPPHSPQGQGGAAGVRQPPARVYAGAPKAAQSKRASGKTPSPASPAAPPAYRPQTIPKVLQTKTAPGRRQPPPAQARSLPAPPPVYRPQPAPKVLQPKGAGGAREAAEHKASARSPQAPAVYRPQTPPRVCQLKSAGVAAPPRAHALPPKPHVEAKLGSARTLPRAAAPAAAGVIQRAAERSSSDDEMDLMDDLADAPDELLIEMGLKPPGQAYGSKESKDDDDDDWLPPGIHVRPPKPGALWSAVYSAIAPELGVASLYSIACAELKDGKVYMLGKGRKECDDKGKIKGGGKGKKPPVCHVIPYNHLMWAWRTIATRGGYKGPGFTGSGAPTDQTAHAELAWGNLKNLRPGHAVCNLKTAFAAAGEPPGPSQAGILKYVEGWCKGKKWIT